MGKDTKVKIDEDLADGVRGAKKSPRNFAIICKGTKPVKVIIQKKAIRAGELAKAKTESKGNDIITGVVQTEGADHVFLVTGDLPSLKPTALKEFISEQTELTCKPRFAAVKELPKVAEDEVEGNEGESSEGNNGSGNNTGNAPSNDTNENEASENESDENGDNQGETNQNSGNTAVAEQEEEAGENETEDGPSAEESKLAILEALKALVPGVQKAIADDPARRMKLLAAIDGVKKLAATDLVAAQTALDELELSLVDTSKVSIVKLGKSRLEWKTTRDTAGADLKRLKKVIADEFVDDKEQAAALAAAMKTFDNLVAEVENDLHEQLDTILNADPEARKPLIVVAKKTIAKLSSTLDNDEVMAEIDDNEFIPGFSVVAPLKKKLQDISAALG